jgi:PEP-CTERM motif-containing protein
MAHWLKFKVGPKAVGALVAAAVWTALAPMASATVELELTSGLSTTGVIVGAPCGTDTCVAFSGTVGQWTINLTSGDSGGSGNPTTDLSSLNATTSGFASPLNVELSNNGFTTSTSSLIAASSGTLLSGTGTETYSAYLDNGNTDFAKTRLIGTLGPFSASYAAAVKTGPGPTTTPFSLTEDLVLTAGSGGVKWNTYSGIVPPARIPEPGSLLLLGSGLLGFGGFARKKPFKG